MSIVRKTVCSALFLGLCMSVGIKDANAGPKPWYFSWWPSHWATLDFEPYLENGTDPHNSQWENVIWRPEHWSRQRNGRDIAVIEGFYRADVLRAQEFDDDVPVVVVGPGFYRLGGHDKRRLATMIDHTYGVTARKENGIFLIRDWKTDKDIGVVTKYGLQIQ